LIISLGVTALLQAIAAFGLVPFGIRVLARSSTVRTKAATLARGLGIVNVFALGLSIVTYLWIPGVHWTIRVALAYGVALPVAVYALLSLVLAALMTRAAKTR
jgi:hypothetical protein